MASIMSHIGTFEKTGSANSILGSFVQVKKSRDGAQLRKPKKVSIKTVNVYANGSARSSTSFAPVSSVDKVDKIPGSPNWSVLSEEISVGSFPRSPRDLELLVQSTGINAFVLLETEEGVRQIGLDWDDFRKRVNQQGAVAVRLSMKANDKKDQTAALPETVRAVAALVKLGYKVHVSCTNGTNRSPLVALGYLTLFKGQTLTEAWETITKANPLARPNIDVLRDVSDKKMRDAFERGVATDVSLSDAVAKATTTRATRLAFEELAEYKAKAESVSQNSNSSKERLEFFSRQIVSLKEKEEAARKAAALAVKEKEALSRQLQALTSGSPSTPPSASPVAPVAPSASASPDIQVQIRALTDKQSAAKKEVAKLESSLKTATEKFNAIESSVSEAVEAKKKAEIKLKDVKLELQNLGRRNMGRDKLEEKKLQLTRLEADAKTSITAGQDKIEFFDRQLSALKTKQSEASEAVSAAKAKLDAITKELSSLQASPVPVTAAVTAAPVAVKSDIKAQEALSATKEKLEFFQRKLEEQKTKQENENKKAEERIGVFASQVSELKQKLAAADALASENEKKVGELVKEIEDYQKKEKASIEASKVQKEKMDFFSRYIENLRKKEESARSAARLATDKAKILEKKIQDFVGRESLANQQIQSLNSKVATLVQVNAEQGVELNETKERESQLLQVLEDGTGMLTKALEADKTIKQMKQEVQDALKKYEQERVRADLLAAELERELVAAGKKPKHYNDIEKVPSSDLEKQLLAQLATTKQTLVASGSAFGVVLEKDTTGDQIAVRDIILGALSTAAVPLTLMSIFSDAQPQNIQQFTDTSSSIAGKNELVQILEPEDVLPPEPAKPIVKSTSPEDFCKQTLTGSRSARVERFCNSLAEIGM